MKYDVLWDSNINDLIHLVNCRIKQGWKPLGGIMGDGPAFYQAMVTT